MNSRQSDILSNLNEAIARAGNDQAWCEQIAPGLSDVPALQADVVACGASAAVQKAVLEKDYALLSQFGNAS